LDRVENNPGATGPEIKRAERGQTFDFLVGQTFLPHSPQALIKTLQLLERLYDTVPVYNLTADMSRESVMVSAGCLLGAEALRDI